MTTDDPLRLWLRLFTCSTLIERELGARLKRSFGSSLPRFDLLAQLDRAPDGLRMTTLSQRLLVTGGNVTWLVTSLARDGHVRRTRATDDRRAVVVTLTPSGRRHFRQMARAHHGWVEALMAPLAPAARRATFDHLGVLKRQFAPESP
ncbi:MAG: MarR family transcriptional regulator [Gemmatimonadaceae bacterium]|nr:MarR family transcriptional regulator [Gemmatimonadaceae bacterium]